MRWLLNAMTRCYLQYHNAQKLGWVPYGDAPFLERHLAIRTRVRSVRAAVGGTVFLIVKLPNPTAYYLWESFTVERVAESDGAFQAWGPGRQLVPPALLHGPEFEAFRKACAYFVGFQSIDRHPYLRVLRETAEAGPRDDLTDDAAVFATRLVTALPTGDSYYHRAFVYRRLGLAALARLDAQEALRRGTEHRAAAEALLTPLEAADAAPVSAVR